MLSRFKRGSNHVPPAKAHAAVISTPTPTLDLTIRGVPNPMSNLKAVHYSGQLYSALTRGAWADPNPAKAANGKAISWAELFRKYKKHSISRPVLADLALHVQGLTLLLAANQSSGDNIRDSDIDGDEDPTSEPLVLGNDCVLEEERREEALVSYAELDNLINSASHDQESLLLTKAYYAYALALPDECLRLLAEAAGTPPSNTSSTLTTSTLSVPPSVGTSRGSWASQMTTLDEDIREGRTWCSIEQIRSKCLLGMCHEKKGHFDAALVAYESAFPVIYQLSIPTQPPLNSPRGGSTDLSSSVFARYRELWRWVERLLWRTSIIASKTHHHLHSHPDSSSNPIEKVLPILRLYATNSIHFTPKFRPSHRHTVASLHLRALLLTAPPPLSPSHSSTPTPMPSTSRLTPTPDGSTRTQQTTPHPHLRQTPLAWITEARTLIGEYRIVLHHSTKFPKAGERNSRVEEFVDYVVEVWRRAGDNGNDAGWAIDILWWATRLTFHSHRIFRHLTHLLHVASDNDIAKKTMRLYVQLVTKAKQAGLDQVEDQVRRSRSLSRTGKSSSMSLTRVKSVEEVGEHSNGGDSDRHFVEMLIFGARMLCRLNSSDCRDGGTDEVREAGDYLKLAKETIKKDKRLSADKYLEARMLAAEGIWEGLMAIKETEPLTEPVHLQSSLALLKASAVLDPVSADTQYHLALALASAGPTRDISQAVLAARQALELDTKEVRYWHLLGLVLSAQEDFKGAKAVLELGEAVEDDSEDDGTEQHATGANGHPVTEDSASQTSASELLSPDDTHLPPPSNLQLPLPEHPTTSREQRFEHGLDLRMTLLAIIEMTEGAESTASKWVEVFAWFAERGGWAAGTDRRSVDFATPDQVATPLLQPHPGPSADSNMDLSDMSHPPTLRLSRSKSPPSPRMQITLEPPTPGLHINIIGDSSTTIESSTSAPHRNSSEKNEKGGLGDTRKRASRMLREQVNKGQSQLHSISRKIAKNGNLATLKRPGHALHRSNSAPGTDFHAGLSSPYQASSIHSRQRMTSPFGSYIRRPRDYSPVSVSPPPPPPPPPAQEAAVSDKTPRERRLLSNLWLLSAATFRRMGKIEQARVAIQEAEVLDEGNEGVWVQLGLYFAALGNSAHAIESFHKALVISPDHVPALVHLCRQYLSPGPPTDNNGSEGDLIAQPEQKEVDLAAGLLSNLIACSGRDVPEAWYLFAKACKLQGRKERERECLAFALTLVEGRAIRDLREALGGCL